MSVSVERTIYKTICHVLCLFLCKTTVIVRDLLLAVSIYADALKLQKSIGHDLFDLLPAPTVGFAHMRYSDTDTLCPLQNFVLFVLLFMTKAHLL